MNFFEHQESARKKTGRLVFLFVMAVLALIVMIYFVAMALLGSQSPDAAGDAAIPILLGVTLFVGVVVGGGSLFRISQLSGGGSVVADSLGGKPVARTTNDPAERRLLNIVEEMALASGVPVPPVYVIEERSINAFAAGHSIDDAVVGVTRGTLDTLNRDELQGVIAHEFSHIFNGDMRLNIRLMGVLHGILLIGLIGGFVLRGSFWGGLGRRRRDGGGGGIVALAAALAVLGYVGTFFGNLIKAAVSRQREYLADASAVQFTRNPAGIAGALKKIGGLQYGSKLEHPRAAEVSHMLFGQGFKSFLGGLGATHPPLEERIRRIEPGFDGRFPAVNAQTIRAERSASTDAPRSSRRSTRRSGTAAAVSGLAPATTRGRTAESPNAAPAAPALSTIGEPTAEQIRYASELASKVPHEFRTAVEEPFGARAAVFALLLDSDAEIRDAQLAHLDRRSDAATRAWTLELELLARGLDERLRLMVVDLAIPTLRQMSRGQYRDFEHCLEALTRADAQIDVFEWVVARIVVRHVGTQFDGTPKSRRLRSMNDALPQIADLLTTLAHAGHASDRDVQEAFDAGARALGHSLKRGPFGLAALERALDVLDGLRPTDKQSLLAACAAVIEKDREITVRESQLFRAIAESLHCPLPPVLAGQPLA